VAWFHRSAHASRRSVVLGSAGDLFVLSRCHFCRGRQLWFELGASEARGSRGRDQSFVRVEAISRRVLEEGFEWKWTFTKEYLDVLGTRLGINVAALVGHIAVRHYVMGEDAVECEATPEEIAQMQRLVRQGMESGAVGFSTNQNPRHMREDKKPVASRLASKEELG